ncbi:universal stress protein [Algicella marina]|uniref:Universal stress protein n=1 Tax=Algicella marina TaxID=2683284 RepID=A0A6P1T382_9RHOB|nr:universal stress protein [Algicella marina]QHQ36180.1 universal stress protein [Algicella marina]
MSRLAALIDASAYSKSVLDHTAWIATKSENTVEVLHVLGRRESGDRPMDLSGAITLGARTQLLEELAKLDGERAKLAQTHGRLLLEEAKLALEAQGVANVTTRLRLGDIVDTIEDTEADLLIIGKRGESADFAKLHLGSNMERIARSAKTPVFVANRAFRPIEKVLVAFDGGPHALKAIDHISRSPTFAGLKLHLITASTNQASAQAGLEKAQALLAAAGHTPTIEVVPGEPATVIADAVGKGGFDLLVMGAYGHSRIRNLFIGSTTSEMVRSCKVPIILFR